MYVTREPGERFEKEVTESGTGRMGCHQKVNHCISCVYGNITKIFNRNTSRRLSVLVKQLFYQTQRILIPLVCQEKLLIHLQLCLKTTEPIGSRTAIFDLLRFFCFFCFVLCLSNNLYKKFLLFLSIINHFQQITQGSFFLMSPQLTLKLKSKTLKFNPLRGRVVIYQNVQPI